MLFYSDILGHNSHGIKLQDGRFNLVGYKSVLSFEPIVLLANARIFATTIWHFYFFWYDKENKAYVAYHHCVIPLTIQILSMYSAVDVVKRCF